MQIEGRWKEGKGSSNKALGMGEWKHGSSSRAAGQDGAGAGGGFVEEETA